MNFQHNFTLFRELLLLIVFVPSIKDLNAQRVRHFGVKVDLTAVLQARAGAAFEWRINSRSGFELQLDAVQHNKLPPHVFNGNFSTEYAQRSIDSTSWGKALSPNHSDWSYLGTGRPLAALPPPVLALSTIHARLGYRISYERREGRSRIFLQPAINVYRHRYFESAEKTFITGNQVESWQVGSLPNELQVIRRTVHYQQSLEMRQQDYWTGGISYDIGTALHFKCGITLEGRLTVGLNFGEEPYSAVKPPASIQNFYGGAAVNAGYFFGKKEASPLPANL